MNWSPTRLHHAQGFKSTVTCFTLRHHSVAGSLCLVDEALAIILEVVENQPASATTNTQSEVSGTQELLETAAPLHHD